MILPTPRLSCCFAWLTCEAARPCGIGGDDRPKLDFTHELKLTACDWANVSGVQAAPAH